MRHTIVIAWIVMEWRHDGLPYAHDIGARPAMREVREAKACVWVLRGSQQDAIAARAYVDAQHADTERRVYLFEPTENDPIGRAKRELLAECD